MITINFCAAHRELGANMLGEGALHGHTFTAAIAITERSGQARERVYDLIKNWIDERWQYNVLLHREDSLLKGMVDIPHRCLTEQGIAVFHRVPYICQQNPTIQNMAEHLAYYAREKCDGYHILKVFVGDGCNADAKFDFARDPQPVLTPVEPKVV